MKPMAAPDWFKSVIQHGGVMPDKMTGTAGYAQVVGEKAGGDTASVTTVAISDGAKHYDSYGYMAYGGATTFAEQEQWEAAQEVQYAVSDLFWTYRSLFDNIICSPDLTPKEKAARVSTLTDEFSARLTDAGAKEFDDGEKKIRKKGKKYEVTSEDGSRSFGTYDTEDAAKKRLGQIEHFKKKEVEDEKAGRRVNKGIRAKLSEIADALSGVKKWADYDDGEDEDEKSAPFEPDLHDGFKMVETPDGVRWWAFSSNAFQDNDKELFSTAALEDAVKAADDGEFPRGPLRIFHVEGADIGDADFSGMAGRVLIESGTFRDDDFGQKALAYLRSHPDEEWQVSIGYKYLKDDDKDGVYDWVRIKERSILPKGMAANPFTGFAFTIEGEEGSKEMDPRKTETLGKLLGEDNAKAIIARAESNTKALEAAGVGYKEDKTLALIAELANLDLPQSAKDILAKHVQVPESPAATPEAEKAGAPAAEATPAAAEGATPLFSDEAVAQLREVLAPMAEAITSFRTDLTAVQDEVKSLKLSDAEKMRALATPSGAPAAQGGYQASTAGSSQLDPNLVAKLLQGQKEGEQAKPTNPATPYINDLVGMFPN